MTDQHGTDDDLRALLRSTDPAAFLPPADPDGVARLLEDTMTQPLDETYADETLTDESRADGVRHRSRFTWIVAAAAVLVIGGGVAFATTLGEDEKAPLGAAPGPTAGAGAGESDDVDAPTVTNLKAGADAGVNAKCMTPEMAGADVIGSQQVVFDGTVQSISGGTVTLVPSTFYAGDPTDEVVVQAPGPEMEALLSAVRFQEGKRYLVSATDGQVTFCGFTAEYSDSLAEIYADAFAS